MSIEDLSTSVASVVVSSLATFIAFIPALIGGFIVLAIGLVLGAIVYRAVIGILKAAQVEKFLEKYGIVRVEGKEMQ